MKITRSLKASDIDQIELISRSVPQGSSWFGDRLQGELAEAQSLGIFEDSELFAFAFFRSLPTALELSWLATHPKHRKKGFMRQLLSMIFAAHGHLPEVWLEVEEKNWIARNLYEKVGFVVKGKRINYYPDGGTALLMTRVGP